jgi:hypothetical protein
MSTRKAAVEEHFEAFAGRPTLVLDRLVEEGDVVTFESDLTARVESYLVPLTGS